jgi:thioredoxin reductase
MPQGMVLKSDGFASNLYDPDNDFSLSRYCMEQSIEYGDELIPVPLQTFIDYGLAFRDRFVPSLEETNVSSIRHDGKCFVLDLCDGVTISARRVVIAIGVGHFRHVPELLAALPADFVSHSYDHHDLDSFADRCVAVLGGGASAIDLAALLKERGCEVQLICRSNGLKFANPPTGAKRSLWQRLRHPRSGLGPGLRSRLCTDAPMLFHFMPERFRLEVVRRHLGPAAGWPMKDKLIGRVPLLTGHRLVSAAVVDGSAALQLRGASGDDVIIRVDHIVAATGYRVDIRRLDFLDSSLLSRVKHVDQTPILSTRFESSVEGLFFIGPVAANSFGPLMRFAFGANFAARRLMPILSRPLRMVPSPSKQPRKPWHDVEATPQP